MNSLLSSYLASVSIHPSTTWLISQCTEARGKQDLWRRTKPEILKSLQESAIIQSTESSNRIEGVEVDSKRLRPLILGDVTPKNRSEEEVVGYKKALNYIYSHYDSLKIGPSLLKKLHALAQEGSIWDAGKFKVRDNDIVEILPTGERFIRFETTKVSDVEYAVEQLCLGYNDVINKSIPDLLVIANFVFDFLCIHPFRDGNGRVSRILTTLLLLQSGYLVGRYISIERLIEENKEDYYRVLKESSEGWHSGHHNLLPWWNYFFSIVKAAYQELNAKVEAHPGSDNKSALIREIVLGQERKFQLSDIEKLVPDASTQLIKKVLSDLKKEGRILLQGRGAGAYWESK